MTSTRKETIGKVLYVAAPVVFTALVCLPVADESFRFLGGDNAVYLLLGGGIAEGKGYAAFWRADLVSYVKYPPLFPAFIALFMKTAGENLLVVKSAQVLLLCVSALACLLCVNVKKRSLAALVAAAAFSSYALVFYTGQLLSEVLYVALSFGAILYFEACFQKKDEADDGFFVPCQGSDFKCLLMASLLAVMASLTRVVGFCLVFVIVFFLLKKALQERKRRPRHIGFAASIVFISSLWPIRNLLLSGTPAGAYGGEIFLKDPYRPWAGKVDAADLLGRIIEQAGMYVTEAASGLFLWEDAPGVLLYAVIVLLIPVAVSLVRGLKKGSPLCAYVALYFLVICFWPYYQERFIVPLLPFLVIMLVEGTAFLGGRAIKSPRAAQVVVYILLAAMLIAHVAGSAGLYLEVKYEKKRGLARLETGTPVRFPHAGSVALWRTCMELRHIAREGDVVMARKASLVALATGLSAVPIPYRPSDLVIRHIKEHEVRYIIMDRMFPESKRYLFPLLKRPDVHLERLSCTADDLTCLYFVKSID